PKGLLLPNRRMPVIAILIIAFTPLIGAVGAAAFAMSSIKKCYRLRAEANTSPAKLSMQQQMTWHIVKGMILAACAILFFMIFVKAINAPIGIGVGVF